MPFLRPPRWRMLFWKLVAFAGFIAAVFSLLWALGWLARTFGYQSNDANLPTVLALSALIFAALLWLLPGAVDRLRKWWRG